MILEDFLSLLQSCTPGSTQEMTGELGFAFESFNQKKNRENPKEANMAESY